MSQAAPEGHLIVRDRQDEDLEACERLVEATHLHDRYPVYLGTSARSFFSHPGALGAWVAELDNTVIGHIALHPATSKAVMTLACERLKITADQIAVVSRLQISPRQRGRGTGRRLLTTAVTQAQARHLQPVLDVDMNLTAAIALYERAGWQRIGVTDVDLPDGTLLHEAVYALNFTLATT
jgi:GNAT superfamily N-acetyltransferase